MRLFYHWPARCLAAGLLLAAGCAKNAEPPVPTASRATAALAVPALRQAFANAQLDQQLVQPIPNQQSWTWTPRWDKASQQRVADSATYTYVPLEAYLPARPYVVTLVGVRKYLLIKESRRGLSFCAADYVFKAKENPAWSETNVRPFYAAFTGVLLLKNLVSGATACLAYAGGQRQARPTGKAPAGGTAGRGSSCYTVVHCNWNGICASELEPHPSMTYGSATSGIDYCTSPSDDGVGCSRIVWTLTNSYSQAYCSGGGDDPGNPDPDPGPGPGNPGNPGPATPETPCQHMNSLGAQPVFRPSIRSSARRA